MDRKLIWLLGVVLIALGIPFWVGYIFFKEGTLFVLFSIFVGIMPIAIAREVFFGRLYCPVNINIVKAAIGK